jgi:hypothetical protein
MSLLLTKGVVGRELDVAFQKAVGEAPEARDRSLIDILIEHKASVNFVDTNGNCVRMAAMQSDLKILQKLCSAQISAEIVSSAPPLGFACMRSDNYSVAVQMMNLLLQKGARGTPIASTLIQAACQDHDHLIVGLLQATSLMSIIPSARPQKRHSAPKIAAILKLICGKVRFEQKTLARLVPEALDPQKCDLVTSPLLVKCCEEYPEILSSALLDEIEIRGARREVSELLLQHEASVGFNVCAVLR